MSRQRPTVAHRLAAGLPGGLLLACPAWLGAQTLAQPPDLAPAGWGAEVLLQSDRFSDPLPLADLLASRLAGLKVRHGQSLIYLRDEARMTARLPPGWAAPASGQTTLSVLARQSATLVANRGAVTLTQDIAASGPPPGDYDAQVNLRLRAFAGWGAEWGWQGAASEHGLQWQVAVQGLQLVRVLTRDIQGWAQFDATNASYATQLQSDQFNDRHRYPFQGPSEPRGWAWLGQVNLRWQASPQWAWHVGVTDLGWLHWRRVAHETARLDSQVASTDSQGNVVYASLVNGHNGQDTLATRAPATWRLGGAWGWAPGSTLEADVRKITGVQAWLPYSGVRQAWGEGPEAWGLSAGWRWHERAVQLGLQHGPWQVQLAGDALDASARSRMASVRWQHRW